MASKKGGDEGAGMVERYMAASGEERIKMWLDTHNGPGVAGVPNPKVRPPPSRLSSLPNIKAKAAQCH